MKYSRFYIFITLVSFLQLFFFGCSKSKREAKHIILIGIDGMGISGFQTAKTPNLDKLVREGALSLKTRGVMPTVSGPNWGSHLLGAGPEQHGITYNDWTTANHTVEATLIDEDGYFPSVFNIIREQIPDAKTGFFYDWNALANFYNTSLIDEVVYSKNFNKTFEKATPWIIESKPEFTFIYIGHPDEVGHKHKWGSPEYVKALEDVDEALGTFFLELKKAGLYDEAHFIVITDHGGVEYGHGGLSMEEIQIPWIIAGPGIIKNRMIEQANDVYNTASTILYLLDLNQPYEWIGRPVLGAFEGTTMSEMNDNAYVPEPISSHNSGMYIESNAVSFKTNDKNVKIRFSVNGKDPDINSLVYESPILLMKSTTLKAAGFIEENISRITTIDYVKVKPITNVFLTNMPDEQYFGNGEKTLFDLETGTHQYNDGNWLGFKGFDLEAVVELPDLLVLEKVSLGVLNVKGSWIFPPESIALYASVNKTDYKEIGILSKEQIDKRIEQGRNVLGISTKGVKAKYIKIIAENIGTCPPGHSGEGEPAWLFVDEIIVE